METKLTPLLVNSQGASKLLGIGQSLFFELVAAGELPRAIKLHSRSLWSVKSLEQAIDAKEVQA